MAYWLLEMLLDEPDLLDDGEFTGIRLPRKAWSCCSFIFPSKFCRSAPLKSPPSEPARPAVAAAAALLPCPPPRALRALAAEDDPDEPGIGGLLNKSFTLRHSFSSFSASFSFWKKPHQYPSHLESTASKLAILLASRRRISCSSSWISSRRLVQ